jgi:hypothetical protein
MKFNQAEIIGNQLIIKGRKSPLPVRITLILFLLICLLIPIAATFLLMAEKKGPHIGIFVSFLLFWGIGFYLLRIILWNTFGREIITLGDDKIFYEADYLFFKDSKTSISTKALEVVAAEVEDGKSALGVLIFSNENVNITTSLKAPLNEMSKIAEEIEKKY